RAEPSPDLVDVGGGVAAREDNPLGHPGPMARHWFEAPHKRQDGAIERQVDYESLAPPHITEVPVRRVLSPKPGHTPRAARKWTVELKLRRRVDPVLDIGPPAPRKRPTDLDFNRMFKFQGDVRHSCGTSRGSASGGGGRARGEA